MKLVSKTQTFVQLTNADIREALSDFITNSGLAITPDEVPANLFPESIDFEVTQEVPVIAASKPVAKTRSTTAKATPAKAAPAKPVEVEPEKEEVVVGTQVPDEAVEAYRAKKAAEEQAKKEAAAKVVETPNPFDDEPAEPNKPEDFLTNDNETPMEDSLDDDEDDLVEDETPLINPVAITADVFADDDEPVAKITPSIFDLDEEPAVGTTKITENLFAD